MELGHTRFMQLPGLRDGHFRIRLGRQRSANPVVTAEEIRRCRWIYWRMQCVSGHGIVPHSDLERLGRSTAPGTDAEQG